MDILTRVIGMFLIILSIASVTLIRAVSVRACVFLMQVATGRSRSELGDAPVQVSVLGATIVLFSGAFLVFYP